jgi:hypothetical protein
VDRAGLARPVSSISRFLDPRAGGRCRGRRRGPGLAAVGGRGCWIGSGSGWGSARRSAGLPPCARSACPTSPRYRRQSQPPESTAPTFWHSPRAPLPIDAIPTTTPPRSPHSGQAAAGPQQRSRSHPLEHGPIGPPNHPRTTGRSRTGRRSAPDHVRADQRPT